MQTFLPYPNYTLSAFVLDPRRVNKQRVECKQILLAMNNSCRAWHNHPATQMWKGYEYSLCQYALEICSACDAKQIQDRANLRGWFENYRDNLHNPNTDKPYWLGDQAFHKSHRASLLAKDPTWYSAYWNDAPFTGYVWPSPTQPPV